jgi:hypothetical protein
MNSKDEDSFAPERIDVPAGRPPGPNPRATVEARAHLRDRDWLRFRLHEDGVGVPALAAELDVAPRE